MSDNAEVSRRGFLQLAATASGAALLAPACAQAPSTGGSATTDDRRAPGLPDASYFRQLSEDLAAAGLGTPQILIDLDRLDSNAAAIASGVGAGHYRVVEKSLPSLELLAHVSAQTGSHRFLVLHLPFLPGILSAFPAAQVLVGKAQPIAAVKRFFGGYSAAELPRVLQRVSFLADTPLRLAQLLALAKSFGTTVPLQVGVEIDVGLHRGGVRHPSNLPTLLSAFAGDPALRFAGMLGYDGHVADAPAVPGFEEAAARRAFAAATASYQAFVDVLRAQFPVLWRDDLIFNSGGSATYPLYKSGPVNDVAAGGGMLRPAAYSPLFTGALTPASFIAAPILFHEDSLELPFLGGLSRAILPGKQCVTVYGGGWPAEFVHPPGVSLAPLVNDPAGQNLVPNQSWLIAPRSPPLPPDSWIFQHPLEADAIFQFEDILLVRGGRLQPSTWKAFPRRY